MYTSIPNLKVKVVLLCFMLILCTAMLIRWKKELKRSSWVRVERACPLFFSYLEVRNDFSRMQYCLLTSLELRSLGIRAIPVLHHTPVTVQMVIPKPISCQPLHFFPEDVHTSLCPCWAPSLSSSVKQNKKVVRPRLPFTRHISSHSSSVMKLFSLPWQPPYSKCSQRSVSLLK